MPAKFPGRSKSRVNRAGDNIRIGQATPEDWKVFEDWRFAHRHVLNTFQALLRGRIKKHGISAIVTQRHKRRSTIVDKLNRYPKMKLSRMDDVAGCRIILNSISDLYNFRENIHSSRIRHVLKNDIDRYDYIKYPKISGYRGVHDVYSYVPKSYKADIYKGLLIEVQYRTKVQHSWATAVEIIGNITSSQPKFDRGDKRYLEAMALSSEILARAYEDKKGAFSSYSDSYIVDRFVELDNEINLLPRLEGINEAKPEIISKKNVILVLNIISPGQFKLDVFSFDYATDAINRLKKLEEKFPSSDIVFVRGESSEDISLAYKNYFSNARDFVSLVKDAIDELTR